MKHQLKHSQIKEKACLLIVQVLHRCSCANTLHTIYRKHKVHLWAQDMITVNISFTALSRAWMTSHLTVFGVNYSSQPLKKKKKSIVFHLNLFTVCPHIQSLSSLALHVRLQFKLRHVAAEWWSIDLI